MENSRVNFKINGAQLKIIAIITMLIDHLAAGYYVYMPGYSSSTYLAMRTIGRIAFPIFLFLLIEGYLKTRDVKKYMTRLFIFALVSEAPFDLLLNGHFQVIYTKMSTLNFLVLYLCFMPLIKLTIGF